MKICLLAPYPINELKEYLKISRNKFIRPVGWVANLSKELSKFHDIELHIIVETPVVAYTQVININNIFFHIISSAIPFINRNFPKYLPLDTLSGFYFNSRRINKEIDKVKPDIIHSFGTERAYSLAAINSGYPTLISMQGIVNQLYKEKPNFNFFLVKCFEKKQINKGKYFDCRTNYDSAFVRQINPKAKVFKIHRAVNPVFFNKEWKLYNSKNILYVGVIKELKGIETLLHSIRIVKKNIPDIYLQLIGTCNKRYKIYLENIIKEFTIKVNVIFLGFKNMKEIAAYHLQSQLFVFPSKNDNSPNSIAEAMCTGMPIIASNVGGIPSMIEDGKTGILFNSNNYKELADKIIYLINNPRERQRLGDNARRTARGRHCPFFIAERTIQVYKKIIKENL